MDSFKPGHTSTVTVPLVSKYFRFQRRISPSIRTRTVRGRNCFRETFSFELFAMKGHGGLLGRALQSGVSRVDGLGCTPNGGGVLLDVVGRLLDRVHDCLQLGGCGLVKGFVAQLNGALDERGNGLKAKAPSALARVVGQLLCLGPQLCGMFIERGGYHPAARLQSLPWRTIRYWAISDRLQGSLTRVAERLRAFRRRGSKNSFSLRRGCFPGSSRVHSAKPG